VRPAVRNHIKVVAPAFLGLGGAKEGAGATDATGDRSQSGGQSASLRTHQRQGRSSQLRLLLQLRQLGDIRCNPPRLILRQQFRRRTPACKSIDALKIARSRFAFLSNRLNDLGAYLGVGRKLPHTGFHLWRVCMQGHPKARRRMRAYNARDVTLLERVCELRPRSPFHPNHSALSERPDSYSVCQSTRIHHRGCFIMPHSNSRTSFPARGFFYCWVSRW
jgi:hypothetical protein